MHPPLAQTRGKSVISSKVFDSFPLPLILQFFFYNLTIFIITIQLFFFFIQTRWESSFIVIQSAIMENLVVIH